MCSISFLDAVRRMGLCVLVLGVVHAAACLYSQLGCRSEILVGAVFAC